jgi:DNA-directed RNA polymerase subunit RPC12/RpoP
MVEQKFCPKCGAEMDLSNVFISGKADCPRCGYQGMPTDRPQFAKKAKELPKKEIPTDAAPPPAETADVLDMRDLSGKMGVVFAAVLLMSVVSPVFRGYAPVAALGILVFGGAWWLAGRK